MKHRSIFLIISTLFALPLWPKQRTLTEAQAIAEAPFVRYSWFRKSKNAFFSNTRSMRLKGETATYFHFVPCSGSGFILVSKDTEMPEVLGWSDTDLFQSQEMPEQISEFLSQYEDAQDQIQNGNHAMDEIFMTECLLPSVGVKPLMGDINYNQREPYNNKCPIVRDSACAAGCVATAMASLMRFHQYPDIGTGSVSYTSKSEKIAINYNFSKTTFEWSNMLPFYLGQTEKPYTQNEQLSSSKQYCSFINLFYAGAGKLKIDSLMRVTYEPTFDIEIQPMLCSVDGTFIQPIGQKKSYRNWKSSCYYPSISLNMGCPNNIADGEYRIYIATHIVGDSSWYLAKKYNTWDNRRTTIKHSEYYTPITKIGVKYVIGNDTLYCDYSNQQSDAIATLIAACGASVKMDYQPITSGALCIDAFPSLYKYFKYDANMFYLSAADAGLSDWHEALQKNLEKGLPIIVRATADDNSGHAFIVDGYKIENGQPYYHINWGWSGTSNGYFLLTMLKPNEAGTGGSKSNYAYNQAGIFNAKPEDSTNHAPTVVVDSFFVSKTEFEEGTSETLTISTRGIYNLEVQTIPCCSLKVEMTQTDGTKLFRWNAGCFNHPLSSLTGTTGTFTKNLQLQTLPKGTYVLKLVTYDSSTDTYGKVFCSTSKPITITIRKRPTTWFGTTTSN